MRIVGLWKLHGHQAWLKQQVMDPKIPTELRQAACDGLALFADEDCKSFLAVVATKHAPEVRRTALIALASVDTSTASAKAADFLTSAEAKDDLLELYSAFISRKGGSQVLMSSRAGRMSCLILQMPHPVIQHCMLICLNRNRSTSISIVTTIP